MTDSAGGGVGTVRAGEHDDGGGTAAETSATMTHQGAAPSPPLFEGLLEKESRMALLARLTAVDDAEKAEKKAEKVAAELAAVEAEKRMAPEEVRLVLDGSGFLAVYGTEQHKRVARVTAGWLVEAHAAAHENPARKRLARLVLGKGNFTTNMTWAGVFEDPYKVGLRQKLEALGAPLGESFVREGLFEKLGSLKLRPHAAVVADQARCAEAGEKHVLRCDMEDVVPHPVAFAHDFNPSNAKLRQKRERVFMHLLVLMALALNEKYHEMMREILGPHVVVGEGVMTQDRDGSWRVTLPKGFARMEW
jgi:hypothetical protein